MKGHITGRKFVRALIAVLATMTIAAPVPDAQAVAPDRPVITNITTDLLSFTISVKLGAYSTALTKVEYSTDNGSTWATSDATCTSTCSILVTQQTGSGAALAYGDNYDVLVRVTNADGSASSASYPVYLITTPAAPTITAVTTTASALQVTFTLGADGGAPILSIDYSTNNGTNWRALNCNPCATASSALLTTASTGSAITTGTTYVVVLRAKNRVGTSAVSAPTTVTSGKAPAAPTLSSVVAGLESLVVTSTLGALNGSSMVDVEYSTDNGTTWRSSGQATGSFTITEKSSDGAPLDAGVSYAVRVRAVGTAGTSTASATKMAVPIGYPLPPVLDNVIAGTASLSIKGTIGLTMGGAVQRVEYSTDGGTTWTSSGQATASFTITAPSTDRTRTLAPGTRYRVAIRTVTAAGTSGSSNVIEAMVGRVPGPLSISSATLRNGIMVVSGTIGLDNGSPVLRLEYSTDNGNTWWPGTLVTSASTAPSTSPATTTTTVPASTTTTTPATTTTTVPNTTAPSLPAGSAFRLAFDSLSRDGSTVLDAAATYSVRVRAVNAVGAGTASNTVKSSSVAGEESASSAHKITFTDPGSKRLGGAPFTVAAKSSVGAAVTIASTTPQVCTVAANKVTLLATGTCTLVATAPATSSVDAATASRSFTVLDKPAGLTVGSSTSLRAASVDAGLDIPAKAALSGVSKTPKVCTVVKGKVTAVKAGTCLITLTSRTGGKARKLDLRLTTVAK